MIVCKYKFDKSIYENLIPVFNDGYNGYTISDEIDSENSNHVIRTIECDILPNIIRFGNNNTSGETTVREHSLLYVYEVAVGTNIITGYCMFRGCKNLSNIEGCDKWDTSNVTNMSGMFNDCNKLTSLDVSNFNTSKVADMRHTFKDCKLLTSLDLSNFDTSNVKYMNQIFRGCQNLTSLDLSNFDTSKVTDMSAMFRDCTKLTSLDVSNFDTSNVSKMDYMFYNCKLLTSLDVSKWDTKNVTNMDDIFNNTSLLKDIGMLYCTPSTINTIVSNLPTTHTQTIWVQDTDVNKLTSVSGVEFKEYKENSVMINLSSPLLQGDRIEVKDGKLCHYHKMGKVVLDGSDDEWWKRTSNSQYSDTILRFDYINYPIRMSKQPMSDKFIYMHGHSDINNVRKYEFICNYCSVAEGRNEFNIWINKNRLATADLNGFKQWLSENPTTVVYTLAEPYYEDITPLQSDVVLETYLECNMDIYTKLPIKANVSYITNVPSLSTLSMRATEMKESDNIIANLTNMLDNEINE